jgi:hypothetical protein
MSTNSNIASLPVRASSGRNARFLFLTPPRTSNFESGILFLRLLDADIVTLSFHYPRAVLFLEPTVVVVLWRYSRLFLGVRK